MSKMMGLIKRNLLIYFKNRSAIIFSMLTPIIVLVLYILFLRGTLVRGIESAAEAVKDFIDSNDIKSFTNGLLLSGILGSAMITVPYNTLSTVISDRETKVDYDLSATPIKRYQIILAYYFASAISAFLMTSAILTAGLALITFGASEGSMYLAASDVAFLYLIVLLGSMSATAIFMPIMVLFKNSTAVGAFMGIISAAAGFVIGAYIPLSEFSDSIQTFCNIFPATGITVLLKKTMLSGMLGHMNDCIGGIDNGMFADAIKAVFGFEGRMFGNVLTASQTSIYIAAVTATFIVLIALVYPKVYKRK